MTPKILLVDDEDSILSAAKRLFRGKNFELLTSTSPIEALEKIKSDDIAVVVSDYRMPSMSGAEFLENVRQIRPYATRLMLTGFLEMPIVQEAVNRAHVFRFITKPWDENDLVVGIETALAHHKRKKERDQYLSEIGKQNSSLETFTSNLETEVLARTQGIEESTLQSQEKQRLVRELTGFVKSLSGASDIGRLAEAVFQELRKFRSLGASSLMILEGAGHGRLLFLDSGNLVEKKVEALPLGLLANSVASQSEDVIQWCSQQLDRKVKSIVTFPWRGRDSKENRPAAVLIVEASPDIAKDTEFLDRITDRMQPVSVVLDRILLHTQIEKARRQWEATFNGFRDPIAVVDFRFRLLRHNETFSSIQESLCHEAFAGAGFICPGCPLPKAVQFMDPRSDLIRIKNQKTFRVHSFPIRSFGEESEAIESVVNYYTDLSRERDLYMKLVQSEKLAAIGLLAGNIAHELNNPLTGIRSMAQVLQNELDATSPFHQDLKEIEGATKRCQSIIDNLLNFSNPTSSEGDVDINTVVLATMPLLKAAVRMQNVHTQFAENLPHVSIPFSQLQQVIFNLVNNACQAMGDGGTLTIKTDRDGSYVCIFVTDTGPGIPKELHERIFESFFTTKSIGQGTGLGLSVSKTMIEKYGGTLTLESTLGQGTTFKISLPMVVP